MAPGVLLSDEDDSLTSTCHTTTPMMNKDAILPRVAEVKAAHHRRRLLRRSIRTPSLKIERAEGNWQYVTDGMNHWEVFDASGGAAVSSIGHKDVRVKTAMINQFDTGTVYVPSMSYTTDSVEDFADFLIDSTDEKMAEAVFYCSGSEGTDAAKKLSYQYHTKLKSNPEDGRCWFIARHRSYHGATLGALETSGHDGRKALFKPILPNNTRFIPPCYPYREMLEGETQAQYVERLADQLENMILEIGKDKVAAFFAEPVVGAALGCVPALPGYLAAMKRVCRKYGVLFILDCVMCGMGRTGSLHAWQEEDVVPDIQLVGKALAGGYAPISAMLVGHDIANALGEDHVFQHGHTFQNFPQACAAGLAVQQIVRDENLLENVRDKGSKLMKKLKTSLGTHAHVGDIRGKGLFIGIEFVQNKQSKLPFDADVAVACGIYDQGMKDGYNIHVYPGTGMVNGKDGDAIIIAPAFNITDDDVDYIVKKVTKLINDFFENLPALQK